MARAFLSIAETAETLGVSADLVYDLTAGGVLPCVQLGARKVVPAAAVDLVVERALAGFDPDAVVLALATSESAAAAPASSDVVPIIYGDQL